MNLLAFLVRGYICSISHEIMPYTTSCKLRTVFGHTLSSILFMIYSSSVSIYMEEMKVNQNSVNFQN